MIAAPSPALSPDEAVRRLASVGPSVWARSPQPGSGRVINFLGAQPTAIETGEDLARLTEAWSRARAAWGDGAVAGVPVAFGYLSYDLGARLVKGRYAPQEPSGWPGFSFRFFDAVLALPDDGPGTLFAVDAAAADRLLAALATPAGMVPASLRGPLRGRWPEASHLAGIARVKAYLAAGDTYQVNLARELEAPLAEGGTTTGLDLALALFEQAPAPFAFWWSPDEQGRGLVGNSPERFLHVSPQGTMTTCPIKGTRRRTAGLAASADPAARELTRSEKDRAEHDMIVDLERNDLGRVCQTGSVRVVQHAELLHLPTVHHLVSTVEGQLRAPAAESFEDVLGATFPGGSITGAPKRRAMEIISELEPRARGPYTGATGWLGAAGDLDLAIAIRTALVEQDVLRLWVGGGIVMDSEPAAELAETAIKAQAFASLWQPPA